MNTTVQAPPHPDLRPQIERHWSIGDILRIQRIRRGLVNQTFRIDTAKGASYILRLYHPDITPDRIRREHCLLNRLAAVAFPLSPRLVRVQKPPTWKCLDAPIAGHRHMALMTCLPGEDRYAWDQPPQHTVAGHALGTALARYHRAVWGWPQDQDTHDPIALEAFVLKRLARSLEGEAQALASLGSLSAALQKCNRATWPALTVHGDYHGANVRWTGRQDRSRICGIFDFEYADHNWRLYEVGMAAAYLATRWEAGPAAGCPAGSLNHPLLAAFLVAYDAAIPAGEGSPNSALPPLQAGERTALPHYLALAHLLTLEWARAPGSRRLGAATADRYARHARIALEWLRQADDPMGGVGPY